MRTMTSVVALALMLAVPPRASARADLSPFNLSFGIVAADFNRDGALDLAVAVSTFTGSIHSGFISVILQDHASHGRFFTGVHYPTIVDPNTLAAGDLNGDGLPDLVVTSSSFGNAAILFQDPNHPGTFPNQIKVPIGTTQSGVAIGDLNGDGLPDIVFAVNTRNLMVLYQDPAGAPGSFLEPISLPINGAGGAVAIGDIDGDGANDLAIALTPRNLVAVLLQDPKTPGTFLPETDYKVGAQPFEVAIGDLNGDSRTDLAVAFFGPPSGLGGGVSVLLQNAGVPGTFEKARRYTAGAGPQDIVIGDLNGDGRADLAVANFGVLVQSGNNFAVRSSVSVLLQKATRNFAFAKKRVAVRNSLSSIALGDFDSDGETDIAAAVGPGASIIFQKPMRPGTFFLPKAVGR